MSNAGAQSLVAGELSSDHIAPLIDSVDAPAGGYRERAVMQRSCPNCGEALSKVMGPADVELDVCSYHGVYLDRGELEVMHRFYVQQAKEKRKLEYLEKRAFLQKLHVPSEDPRYDPGGPATYNMFDGIAQWFAGRSALRRLKKEYEE